MKQPGCYACKHRRQHKYSAQSVCYHPLVATESCMYSGLSDLMKAFLGGRAFAKAFNELGIRGHTRGIAMGWFCWPVNFDPVWLEECNGFEAQED